jgi:hypothetical protein
MYFQDFFRLLVVFYVNILMCALLLDQNAELFTLTYGSMVMQVMCFCILHIHLPPFISLFYIQFDPPLEQLIKDLEDIPAVNAQLDKMGHNIGIRLIDEFLAKSGAPSCMTFRDTAESISKVAFKMFLGITTEVANWSSDGNAFSIILNDNPIVDFVELPPQYQDIQYCNVLCGVIRGALEMIQLQVDCRFVRDTLRGDEVSEIRVELRGVMKHAMADDYKES